MSASITGTLMPAMAIEPYAGRLAIKGGNPLAGYDLGYIDGTASGIVTGRASGIAIGASFGDAVEAGRSEGVDEGLALGLALGRVAGVSAGTETGYADGVSDGRRAGVLAGAVIGRDEGYAAGVEAGLAATDDAFAAGRATAVIVEVVVDPATITAVEPTPDTAPGDAGGFPADAGVAALTPIVIDVVDADSFLVTVTHGAETEAIAYRAGLRGAYVAGSTVTSPAAGTLRLSLVPDGGWSADAVVTVEAHRTGADAATFGATYLLPRAVEVSPVVEVSTGAVDLLDGAFALLPSYLASEAT